MPPSGTTVVTGGFGFLGRHVCERLAARHMPVRALTRTAGAGVPSGVETATISDLCDRDVVCRAIGGASAVVHLAARVHMMQEHSSNALEAFRRVNVEGTRVVFEEALRAGVSTFVFVSSVKAVGESSDKPWTDDEEPAPVEAYGVSKLEAERLIADLAVGTSTRVCIFRLPLVYGPGMKGNMRNLFELVDRGWPLPFGLVENRRSLVYCGNVAAAIEAVLTSTTDIDTTAPFFLSDGADVSTRELVREIARALGRPARLLPVPPALIRVAGRVGDAIGRAVRVPFTSDQADRLLGSLALDASRFARVSGFRPPFTLREGMAATANWYRTTVRTGARVESVGARSESEAKGR
jgi:UDP-N-acetyl-alpha-D-quinovosamine dehydrogenase